MTATDELKMLLEQRGERYVENDFGITWHYLSDPHTATESMDGTLIVTGLTPTQAIAATLGAIDATGERQGAGTRMKVYLVETSDDLIESWHPVGVYLRRETAEDCVEVLRGEHDGIRQFARVVELKVVDA